MRLCISVITTEALSRVEGDTMYLSDNIRVGGLEQFLHFSRQVSAHSFRTDTACGRQERGRRRWRGRGEGGGEERKRERKKERGERRGRRGRGEGERDERERERCEGVYIREVTIHTCALHIISYCTCTLHLYTCVLTCNKWSCSNYNAVLSSLSLPPPPPG